ncbi:hypothetical protein L596_007440 [Steinernema carpocapsae]|uniref:Uncharacterized protein n=1 Tax=Steinernema carpocapsae TaxID=34508 RepID=A0A4U5P9A2_STECR|nr:hypothetical protein L596_007440 [Steinernema carpocapsae]
MFPETDSFESGYTSDDVKGGTPSKDVDERLRAEIIRREAAENLTTYAERNLKRLRESKEATDRLVKHLKEQVEEQQAQIKELQRVNWNLFYDARKFRSEFEANEVWTKVLEERVAALDGLKAKKTKRFKGIGHLRSFLKTKFLKKNVTRSERNAEAVADVDTESSIYY